MRSSFKRDQNPGRNLFLLCLMISLLFFAFSDINGQEIVVRGTVTDASDGTTLPNVNIQEKGTATGTVSDMEGRYEIQVAGPDAVLVFSFVGFVPDEIDVNGRTVIDVGLYPDILTLEETVVIGYGIQRKDDLTGSIAVVDIDDLNRINAVSFDRALQGRAAGVHVTSTSGRPGAEVSVKIRGIGSISRSSEPLYVLDGVPLSQGGINAVNPNDIESIQVLKDASATAIYGTRGANGVVVMTTKRGETGRPVVNYSSTLSLSQVPNRFNIMNADQYSEYMRAAWTAYADKENIADDRNLYLTVYSEEARRENDNYDTDTDWQEALVRTGLGHNHNLSVRGGGEASNYYFSASYYTEEGIMINTGMDRLSMRVNSDFEISDRIKIGQSASISQINNIYESHHINFQPWAGVLVASPLMGIYDPDAVGGYNGPVDSLTGGNERTNVIAEQMLNENTANINRILANAYADVKLLEGLTYTIRLGGEYSNNYSVRWSPTYILGNMRLRDMDISNLLETSGTNQIWQLGNYLEYKNEFGSHSLTGILGYERLRDFSYNLLAGGRNIEFEDLNVLDQVLAGERIGGSRGEERLESALVRFIYDFDRKYLLTASLRRDGSSKFAPGNRHGYFPSFSAGWRMEDDLFPGIGELDMLKVRIGWGQTGNSNIPRYQYLELIDPFIHSRYTFGVNQDLYLGGAPITFQASPQIQWEATEMTNFGVDLNMFNAKVQFTAEYYIKNQDNMLVSKPISATFGKRINFGTGWPTVGAWMNLARVQNRGLELNLLYRNFDREFKYAINTNFSTLKNRIVDLGVSEFATDLSLARNGHTIGSFFGYVAERILQEEDFLHDEDGNLVTNAQGHFIQLNARQETGTAPGDIKFKDLNGDGVINDNDRTIIGKPLPDFIYGFDVSLEYLGWDLNIFINGMHNFDVYNQQYGNIGAATDIHGKDENKLTDVLDFWTPENRSNTMTRAYVIDPNRNTRVSTWFLEDASFIRLRNVQLGYTIPERLTGRAGINNLRVFFSANNILTITGYRGRDPEIGSQDPLRSGVDNGSYPVPRSVQFGITVDI